ncbi:MAG: SPOR domain-containing protein [Planctomycetaceae bacterium]|nr:SPOR domain-containing protein [Planctomycetaceae bacterium]
MKEWAQDIRAPLENKAGMNRATRKIALALLWWAAAPGCTGGLSPQAQSLLSEGDKVYRKGDYKGTIEKMNLFVDQAGSSRRAYEGYYLRGLARLQLGDKAGAKSDLIQAVDRGGSETIMSDALNKLGDLAWEENDMETAAGRYAAALHHVKPGEKPADYSYYQLGSTLQREGKWSEADQQFSKLGFYFPSGELAQKAAARINSRAWTVQAGAYADKSRAQEAAERLKKTGMPAHVEPAMDNKNVSFVVQVGRYQSHQEVLKALERIRQDVKDAFVTTAR